MGVAHDAGSDLDPVQLKAGQRPVGHGVRECDAAQERGNVAGQRMQLHSHFGVVKALARQASPAEGITPSLT